MRFCCLKQKNVVNIIEGRQLGFISDVEFDECTGKICSIIVPGNCGVKSLFQSRNIVIPWRNIVKIGDDVILVEADLEILRTAK